MLILPVVIILTYYIPAPSIKKKVQEGAVYIAPVQQDMRPLGQGEAPKLEAKIPDSKAFSGGGFVTLALLGFSYFLLA